eukprot:TRINITY_DN4763_c0_g1_i6.p1 TRINITY_DN4763_c0_g1~~TRINITY_DN4763_c0_g1_i6.p1  ORF type:complete len:338 (+),score=170.45 TRINITY_DN4763_c0_g1_i6:52-1014(+)
MMLRRALAGVSQRRAASQYVVPGTTADTRRASLKQKIKEQGYVRAMEAHSGLSGLIVEHARGENGERFDALWSSSLTSSTVCGKPDIETIDTTARLRICDEVLDVTSLPMIYDGDTGGHPEIFHFTVKSLERMGVSMCIIEDKSGLKQNSLFGTERKQELASIEDFSEKIARGKEAQVTDDFMVIARLESLIAGWGHDEAVKRAKAFLEAGADGVMIHSKEKDPAEILRFLDEYNTFRGDKMAVVVPTTYNSMTEKELNEAGAQVIIHANQLIRTAYPAMMGTAQSILTHGRSQEADKDLLSVKQILNLIDDGTSKTVRK